MKLTTARKAELNNKKATLFFLFEDKEKNIRDTLNQYIEELPSFSLESFSGKKGEAIYLPLKNSGKVFLMGLGGSKNTTPEELRIAGVSALSLIKPRNVTELQIILIETGDSNSHELLPYIAEGISLGNYTFDRYRKQDKKPASLLTKAVFIDDSAKLKQELKEIELISENVNYCRNLVNASSIDSDAASIAKEAKSAASLPKVTVEVMNKKKLEKAGMGLLLAVNKGSATEPKLVILKYQGGKPSDPYTALVGKGVTFDSGGVNLKRSGSIETMRMDMAGAATVLATIRSAAQLQLKKNIYGVIPLTDNMISPEAFRPGDVFTSYKGLSVEIGNTDAEGRLILADALAYTEKKLKPARIIDLATLTGACIVTFGETVAAYMSDNEELVKELFESSEKTGEKLWRLPLYDDYADRMKSDIADLSNMSSEKNAGTISGGIFLRHFVEKTPWAHIDIAGTAWYSKKRNYRPKNATGFGVRLLIDFLKN